MPPTDDLPPDQAAPLSGRGWVAVTASLVLAGTFLHYGWLLPVLGYALVVAVGFLAGLPGGLLYQADVASFLAAHPNVTEADLPWPRDYTLLSRQQAFRYTTRGIPAAIAHGLLTPIVLLLGVLVQLGIADASILTALHAARR